MILLIKLLLAHFIGDFFLQSDSLIADKEKKKWKSSKLLLHVLIHAVLLSLVVLSESFAQIWWMIPIIVVSHWIIDAMKLQFQGKTAKRRIRWFIADQIAHITVILAAWMFHENSFIFVDLLQSERFWLIITSVLFLTNPSAIIVKALISRWTPDEDDSGHSLADAGKFIGILERLFVFGFVVSGNWEGIGFLLAAKSVFRFGDLNEAKDRNLTEYVLIGTLLSFGMSILIGVAFNYLNA